jgi:hypothetical protein
MAYVEGLRSKQTLLWSVGNFDGNEIVDGQDFLHWIANKSTSSDSVAIPTHPSAGSPLPAQAFSDSVDVCKVQRIDLSSGGFRQRRIGLYTFAASNATLSVHATPIIYLRRTRP